MDRFSDYSNLCDLKYPVICIVGPTASGKSDVSQILATRIDAEIVSADSMQIYKGMDIGTGKLPVRNRIVPHHGIDLVDPGTAYSAALFQDYSRSVFSDINKRGKKCILCGGTGFYIRAAIDDYRFPEGEQEDNPVREEFREFASKNGAEALWEELRRVDLDSANCIHPNNTKRVIRALELAAIGESYAKQKEKLKNIPQLIPANMIGLSVEPSILNMRIDSRVDKMIDEGLVDEVRMLIEHGFKDGITSPQAIGYKEIVSALEGNITLREAIESIKSATRRYAKRQRSWFRQDKRIIWVDANSIDDLYGIANTIISRLELL